MWCGGDTYVSDLITTAGGTNVLGGEARYPKASLEDVVARAPDVIFLPDEPYAFSEKDAADARSRFDGRVIGPFPGHLFTWHGTRTAKGLAFLREVFEHVIRHVAFMPVRGICPLGPGTRRPRLRETVRAGERGMRLRGFVYPSPRRG